MQKSGVKVYHAGCIGTDGEITREALQAVNADTRFLKTVNSPTGHAIIQVDNKGENCIIIYSGANGEITKEYVDEVLSKFDKNTIVVLQNEISNLNYIIDETHKKDMTVVLNPVPFDSSLKNLDLEKISVLVLNETEAYGFTNEKAPEASLVYFKNHCEKLKVIITLGKNGSIYFDCATGKTIRQPAYQVEVKDTTSAGDTFTGYFVSSLAQNLSI